MDALPTTDPADVAAVAGERRALLALGYRMLGSLSEAEDAVQETYARWYALDDAHRAAIDVPAAWLTKVAGRVCLDMLGSARARRERYVGEWLPEPLPHAAGWIGAGAGGAAGGPLDPAERVTLDESVTMALLVVLEHMTPAERVAFVLHDVFGHPFGEVAQIVGRSPAACRKLASSARRRVAAARWQQAPPGTHAAVVAAIKDAWDSGDLARLVRLLDPAAVVVTDGGGRVSAALEPIVGAEPIGRFLLAVRERQPDLVTSVEPVNGATGLVARAGGAGGATLAVIAADVRGGRVHRLWAVRNPDKLTLWKEQP